MPTLRVGMAPSDQDLYVSLIKTASRKNTGGERPKKRSPPILFDV